MISQLSQLYVTNLEQSSEIKRLTEACLLGLLSCGLKTDLVFAKQFHHMAKVIIFQEDSTEKQGPDGNILVHDLFCQGYYNLS